LKQQILRVFLEPQILQFQPQSQLRAVITPIPAATINGSSILGAAASPKSHSRELT
jgi:hypothetical protein